MLKLNKKIKNKVKYSRGMTYVELIVVLSIFATLSSVAIFNYGTFQSKVDVRSLASDIALKIVEAQKSSLSGKLHSAGSASWKPSYGVYFNLAAGTNTGDKVFYYFADLDQNKSYDELYSCPGGECLEKLSMAKGDRISGISVTGQGSCSGITKLNVVYTRPDSSPKINTNQPGCTSISGAEITILSPKGASATIKVYVSGRIQVN